MSAVSSVKYSYPVSRKESAEEQNFHGTIVKDHYKWLEDPQSEAVKVCV